jgi:hypothetical protein
VLLGVRANPNFGDCSARLFESILKYCVDWVSIGVVMEGETTELSPTKQMPAGGLKSGNA